MQITWFVLKCCYKFSAETFFSPPCLSIHSPSVKSSSIRNHSSGLCLTRRAFDVLKRRRLTNTSSPLSLPLLCWSSGQDGPVACVQKSSKRKIEIMRQASVYEDRFLYCHFFLMWHAHIECFTYPWGTFHMSLYLEKRRPLNNNLEKGIGEKGHLQYRPIRLLH